MLFTATRSYVRDNRATSVDTIMTNLTAKQKQQQLQDEIIAAYLKYVADLIKLDVSATNKNLNIDIDNLERNLINLKAATTERYSEQFFADSIEKAKIKLQNKK